MKLQGDETTAEFLGKSIIQSNDWFQTRTQKLWDKHLSGEAIENYLEFGVCTGHSLCYALAKWVIPNSGLAVGLDPYEAPRRHNQATYDRHRELMLHNVNQFVPTFESLTDVFAAGRFGEKTDDPKQRHVCVYGDSSSEFWPKQNVADKWFFPEECFDLVFVDGCHDGMHALLDILGAVRMARKGGIIVVDDYNRFYHRGPRVRDAARAFELIGSNVIDYVYASNKQIAFRKLKNVAPLRR